VPVGSGEQRWRSLVAVARVSENRSTSWLADHGLPAASVARRLASAACSASFGTGDRSVSPGIVRVRLADALTSIIRSS
jgi:hypothetical protein